eukprot:CAMPEP_0169481042 /NCGR_PEP_ID=MMETSP1042-20121227/29896_1 /TAXON_ID=464988 /ORGANISM="Hemiselmis andersenii, Strain CCMP1180" /LENGTH=81 /DNA_ID=CAMNT_0009595747 /DNA_START=196 /DNA_END=441 /DNA_ORIENTATION=-
MKSMPKAAAKSACPRIALAMELTKLAYHLAGARGGAGGGRSRKSPSSVRKPSNRGVMSRRKSKKAPPESSDRRNESESVSE